MQTSSNLQLLLVAFFAELGVACNAAQHVVARARIREGLVRLLRPGRWGCWLTSREIHRDVLASLREGTSFFASTCIFAIGGVLALAKNTDPLVGVAQEVTAMSSPVLLIQVKLAFVALFLTNAFLKFVWSNRVFGYCAVLMSAVPNDPNDPLTQPRAGQAAELNIRAAMNFNRGLRSMYFALGALAWLLGALPLFGATLVVVWVVWSREFASIPRNILLAK